MTHSKLLTQLTEMHSTVSVRDKTKPFTWSKPIVERTKAKGPLQATLAKQKPKSDAQLQTEAAVNAERSGTRTRIDLARTKALVQTERERRSSEKEFGDRPPVLRQRKVT